MPKSLNNSHEVVLPLIHSLVDDKSQTFFHVHASLESAPQVTDPAEFESPQTVGDVAQSIMAPFLEASHLGRQDQPQTTVDRFDRYWTARKDRNACAGWFLVKVQRATLKVKPGRCPNQGGASQIINAAIERFPLTAIQNSPYQAGLLASFWQVHGIWDQLRVGDGSCQLKAKSESGAEWQNQ